jgi:hypothetical protein
VPFEQVYPTVIPQDLVKIVILTVPSIQDISYFHPATLQHKIKRSLICPVSGVGADLDHCLSEVLFHKKPTDFIIPLMLQKVVALVKKQSFTSIINFPLFPHRWYARLLPVLGHKIGP